MQYPYSISKKKIERSRKITMFIKLENTKDEASTGANLNGILTKYDSTTRSNDMSIRGYLQGQDKAIRERIEAKRRSRNPRIFSPGEYSTDSKLTELTRELFPMNNNALLELREDEQLLHQEQHEQQEPVEEFMLEEENPIGGNEHAEAEASNQIDVKDST
eukprot:TRINITY_DN7111_c0_g1_i7.p2 TRINITY_DN7111_c0_g1~~TRINITY_DN7111_c0_g1_i7.p2  ORF type:complete len:161 (-),score=46.16 TRINITY_DN7111_c0_g1_i7:10-492(-)